MFPSEALVLKTRMHKFQPDFYHGILPAIAQVNVMTNSTDAAQENAARRLGMKYRFDDEHMDLFFMAALGWGPTGGLDVGQAFYVAEQIVDGDPDSWVEAFATQGHVLDQQADEWIAKGWVQSAGEMRLKAFASYRSAWQFAGPGKRFSDLYALHQRAFSRAIDELELPGTPFEIPWKNAPLPGHYFASPHPDAPVLLVIGGADTCHEDLFLSVGRTMLNWGYSVALVDLPGQGNTQAHGLCWEAESERPIAAVIDTLISRFDAKPGKIALLGLSLGGYFVARAAGVETRLATVMASTPLHNAGQLFARSVGSATDRLSSSQPSPATLRNYMTLFWKAGARTAEELVTRTSTMRATPEKVTLPFLSILGAGESETFTEQARTWHGSISSEIKTLIELPANTGADGHCQVNGRLRLAQECRGWLDMIFDRENSK